MRTRLFYTLEFCLHLAVADCHYTEVIVKPKNTCHHLYPEHIINNNGNNSQFLLRTYPEVQGALQVAKSN